MATDNSRQRRDSASDPPFEPIPGNRTIPTSERCYKSTDADGNEVYRCTFEGCLFNRVNRQRVTVHYARSHFLKAHLCDKCDQRQQPLEYPVHFKNAHTTSKEYECQCQVTSYDNLGYFEQHEKPWCPERTNRPPGWEGREWDFEKKVFKPISKTTQPPPPLASSSSRSAPAEQRDSFASFPQLPQHRFAPGNSQYNRNDVYETYLEGQGYQSNPFDSDPFSNQHLPQNSPFLHFYPTQQSSDDYPSTYHTYPSPSLQPTPDLYGSQSNTLMHPPYFQSFVPSHFSSIPSPNFVGSAHQISTDQYHSNAPTQQLTVIPTQPRRGSSRRGATSNIGRLPSSPYHPYSRVNRPPHTSLTRPPPTSPVPVLHTRTLQPSSTQTAQPPRSPGQPGDELFDFDAFTDHATHSTHSLRKLRLTNCQALHYGQDFVL